MFRQSRCGMACRGLLLSTPAESRREAAAGSKLTRRIVRWSSSDSPRLRAWIGIRPDPAWMQLTWRRSETRTQAASIRPGLTVVRRPAGRYPFFMDVQIFGTRKSPATRKALRFFSERGWKTHLVDLAERAPSRGELRHFTERFGVERLIDREAKRYQDLGLAVTPANDERWIERLLAEPLLLRQPLVRAQNQFTIGPAENVWKDWADK
jgi:arsenate reductase (glutaredoxin)